MPARLGSRPPGRQEWLRYGQSASLRPELFAIDSHLERGEIAPMTIRMTNMKITPVVLCLLLQKEAFNKFVEAGVGMKLVLKESELE